MSPAPNLCSIAECPVAITGKCHLGHDPVESCPNYGHAEGTAGDVGVAAETGDDGLKPIEICSGDVMHLEDLESFVRAKLVRTVALIGEQRAGKTTLLASMYAMYCKGRFAGLEFAGSRTLVGFAKRHHLALLNSGRTDPATPRTSRSDPVAFFHLALARRPGDVVDLIVSDRSGEAYGAARIDTDLIQRLPELQQAERVCFLLDGAKLASQEQRPAYARQFKQMIHAFHDNGALAHAKAVEVLATKFDLTKTRGNPGDHIKFLDSYESQISAEFREHGLGIACYRVCALPKTDETVGFVGLDDMIKRWTAPVPLPAVAPAPIGDAPRQIDRLLARTTGALA
jgi:hypothetical protein